MLILVLAVAVLAVARLTRLIVEDRITMRFKRAVVKRWGEDSLPAYFVHCPWCMSMWFAAVIMPPAAIWPNRWVLAALAVPAASYLTGLMSSREERS